MPASYLEIDHDALVKTFITFFTVFNPLNAELNPICHLLALLGAHHILYIKGIRVKRFV